MAGRESGQKVVDDVPGGVGISSIQELPEVLEVVAAGEERSFLQSLSPRLGMAHVGKESVA
jgi:hypothetical protein